MIVSIRATSIMLATALALGPGCATMSDRQQEAPMTDYGAIRVTGHRGADDLLTAGLGIDGLRGPAPPFADPEAPTPDELRRRAIWSSWRGIADLTPSGGFGRLYGSAAVVPGREFHAFATVPGARHPHRVAVQIPDDFDHERRCVIVAPASGSRGVYGAISVAASWGLPRGCAIAYTDKGAGSDYFDLDAGQGIGPDGRVQPAGGGPLGFEPPAGGRGVAFKHAHSQDNPEADWGRHVKQAAEFALHALGEAFPAKAPFRFGDTTVIGAALSNGGGALLRAAEIEGEWLDAVVAGEPNVYAGDGPPLYDVATEAALLMPCALVHLDVPLPPAAAPSCGAIATAGLVGGGTDAERARNAYDALRARGWTDAALRAGATSVVFDMWRAVAATYASAYGRFAVGEHPCGYRYAPVDSSGAPRAATAAERAAWWSDASGIPPGAGVGLVPPAGDPVEALQCLRRLWTGTGDGAARVREGIAATRAMPPRPGLPVVLVHGTADGVVPMAFSSAPYAAAARAAGRDVRLWQVERAQHFDAFMALPGMADHYVPLVPYVHAALDQVWAHLYDEGALPVSARIAPRPRTATEPLEASHLAIPAPR